jgi:hypothetical protein
METDRLEACPTENFSDHSNPPEQFRIANGRVVTV